MFCAGSEGERRAITLEMFHRGHIAPSYRRMLHVTWVDTMCLLFDWLLGTRILQVGPLVVLWGREQILPGNFGK